MIGDRWFIYVKGGGGFDLWQYNTRRLVGHVRLYRADFGYVDTI